MRVRIDQITEQRPAGFIVRATSHEPGQWVTLEWEVASIDGLQVGDQLKVRIRPV